MKLRIPAFLLALSVVMPLPVSADTGFTLGGFATIGATYSKSRAIDFAASLTQPNGAGKSKPVSFGVDSKAGVQVAFESAAGLSGVFQMVADHRVDNTHSPEVEWANLKYQPTPDSYLRAGRVVAPVFMGSVYRNVGYAQVPVRQPWEVYSVNPLSHLDGVDAGTRFDVGGGGLSVQLATGRAKATLFPASYKGRAMLGSVSYERGYSAFRAGYGNYKLDFKVSDPTLPVDLYFDVINSGLAAQYLGYATPNLKLDDLGMTMWGLGYQYDPGTWFLQGEYVRRRADGTLVQSVEAAYVLAGYRIGPFKPYVSYAKLRSIQPPLNPPARAPHSCAGWTLGSDLFCDVAYLINTVDSVSIQRLNQSTVSLGVRYDLFERMALKLQYDRITKPGSAYSQTTGQFPTPREGWSNDWLYSEKRVHLLSATVDFTF